MTSSSLPEGYNPRKNGVRIIRGATSAWPSPSRSAEPAHVDSGRGHQCFRCQNRTAGINLFEAVCGRTVFFITHRLNVRSADTIVLMDQGGVMEMGPHDELMQRQGWYYALHKSEPQENLMTAPWSQ